MSGRGEGRKGEEGGGRGRKTDSTKNLRERRGSRTHVEPSLTDEASEDARANDEEIAAAGVFRRGGRHDPNAASGRESPRARRPDGRFRPRRSARGEVSGRPANGAVTHGHDDETMHDVVSMIDRMRASPRATRRRRSRLCEGERQK